MKNNKTKFNRICKDIKSIKIQGARNVAVEGLIAYNLIPKLSSKKKILSLRPTEPMLANVLKRADRISFKELDNRLNENQKRINEEVFKLIKNNSVVFTHCHSSTVIKALIYSKRKGKKFEVYNTETRPLFQGRKTTKELKSAKIKVTMFVDSAAGIALTKSQGTKKADLVLFGTDAVIKKGVINKVGSGMFAEIAHSNNIPVYILTDSWKYAHKIKFEERELKEIWKNPKMNIKNPAFELIKKKFITGIISELGNLKFKEFLKKARKG